MKNFNDIRDWLNADFCEGGGIEEDRIRELYDYAKLLDKALDKACEELANADKLLHQYTKGEYIGKEEWKEYLLKESEKQQ